MAEKQVENIEENEEYYPLSPRWVYSWNPRLSFALSNICGFICGMLLFLILVVVTMISGVNAYSESLKVNMNNNPVVSVEEHQFSNGVRVTITTENSSKSP